uniref:envelope membrane protein n=1 Tax=Paepalanthus alpinus TaxID=1858743 RepID=UPI001F142230|nr:envelope membrane protein [Paepalanthus alpinus]ULQ67291.1 envelope membrane protein [Paepalanthus alpinus]
MKKKKELLSFPYLASIVLLPWWLSLSFTTFLDIFITNWWNTRQSETFLNSIQEKNILKRFIELEELLMLDEIIKEYPEIRIKKRHIGVYQETIQLVRTHNEYYLRIFLHFLTNIICFAILTSYFMSNEKLFVLNSWVQEFFYNLSDTIKAFFLLLFTDLLIGFHSTHGWELLIGSFYNDFGLDHNDTMISSFVSTFPVILDTIVKYCIFHYLNQVSPSLVVIYHSMNE